jgi:hypothetical protein
MLLGINAIGVPTINPHDGMYHTDNKEIFPVAAMVDRLGGTL